ncbi:MAG TPA: hypothetical protein VNM72_04800 [Blastocatellia bacterium]|nr:hypothetical protein [Blastocatellia bacterium]
MNRNIGGFLTLILLVLLLVLPATTPQAREGANQPATDQDAPPSRPLGSLRVISGPTPCDGQECYQIEVTCPEVVEPERATLKVGHRTGSPSRGTILFMTGARGTGLWERFSPDALRVLGELRAAGFRTVQLQWLRGWLVSAPGQPEGQARLACRPATVATWIYLMLHDRGPTTAFCATGNSGGAAQASFMLSHYGLSEILAAVVATGGPPMGRIDLGCIRDDPANRSLWFPPQGTARLIDLGFGFPDDGTGPCSRSDASFRERFQQASIAFGDWQYVYPKTMVWFVFGQDDLTNAVPQGIIYYERLRQEGSPLIRMETVPNTPHDVPSSREGAEKVRDILLSECRPQCQ